MSEGRQAQGRASLISPRATARLQLHRDYPFDAAREQVAYFARLGISHLYASPILTARSGSMHGYDAIDYGSVNPELGGEDGLRRLVAELRRHGMELIVDIVPNHMAVGQHDNAWWMDVLQWGRDSRYAGFFDIDWDVTDPALQGRVLAPFLGKPYGEALEAGEIKLCLDASCAKLYAAYYDHHFPIAPQYYAALLHAGGDTLAPFVRMFREGLRGGHSSRERGFETALKALADGLRSADVAQALQKLIDRHSAQSAEGRALLHRLLERQHYRMAWWRSATDEINWRRFFDVIDLAGLRVQETAVFEAVHSTVFRLYREGLIDGFRVDHIDGLADPRSYCQKLRRRLKRLATERPPEAPAGASYLVVEKILAPGELLAKDWNTDGTSGYVFMNQAGALLHDPQGEAPLRKLWSEYSGGSSDFAEEERRARRRIPQELLAADFNACAHAVHSIARMDPVTRDWSLGAVKRVLAELLVHFPVYRTYADARGRSEADEAIMRSVVAAAKQTCRPGEAPLLDLVDQWLGGAAPRDEARLVERRARLRAIARFQQLTSPVAAKSVEDTAFYRHGTLLSRNEVGADPGQFGMSVEQFHAACAERMARYPAAMLATATHDHKRGEDLRARLAVLSEKPGDWAQAVARWSAANRPLKQEIDGVTGPDARDEYMLYQMLVGAWPFELTPTDVDGLAALCERIAAWQEKAVREAKRRSGWVEPNLAYEQGCKQFLQKLLDPRLAAAFLRDLSDFVASIAAAGALNGLTQTLLRLSTPGVPDLYQGCEWWDLSLVDPDNRRPVDFAARSAALRAEPADDEILRYWQDGRIKQQVISRLLTYRARVPELFAEGLYVPLRVSGSMAPHLIAFARVLKSGPTLLVLAPRLPAGLLRGKGELVLTADIWGDTSIALADEIQAPALTDLLSRRRRSVQNRNIRIGQILEDWPLAALVSDG